MRAQPEVEPRHQSLEVKSTDAFGKVHNVFSSQDQTHEMIPPAREVETGRLATPMAQFGRLCEIQPEFIGKRTEFGGERSADRTIEVAALDALATCACRDFGIALLGSVSVVLDKPTSNRKLQHGENRQLPESDTNKDPKYRHGVRS
jgi:hypothetical protein